MLLASQIVGLFGQQYFKKKSLDHFQFDIQIDKQKKVKTFQKNISWLNFSKFLRGTHTMCGKFTGIKMRRKGN